MQTTIAHQHEGTESLAEQVIQEHMALLSSGISSPDLFCHLVYDCTTRITSGEGLGFNVAVILLLNRPIGIYAGFYAKAPKDEDDIAGIASGVASRSLAEEYLQYQVYAQHYMGLILESRRIKVPINNDSVLNHEWNRASHVILPCDDPAYAVITGHVNVLQEHDWVAVLPFEANDSNLLRGFLVVANPYTHEPFEERGEELKAYWFNTAASFMLKASESHSYHNAKLRNERRRKELEIKPGEVREFLGV